MAEGRRGVTDGHASFFVWMEPLYRFLYTYLCYNLCKRPLGAILKKEMLLCTTRRIRRSVLPAAIGAANGGSSATATHQSRQAHLLSVNTLPAPTAIALVPAVILVPAGRCGRRCDRPLSTKGGCHAHRKSQCHLPFGGVKGIF